MINNSDTDFTNLKYKFYLNFVIVLFYNPTAIASNIFINCCSIHSKHTTSFEMGEYIAFRIAESRSSSVLDYKFVEKKINCRPILIHPFFSNTNRSKVTELFLKNVYFKLITSVLFLSAIIYVNRSLFKVHYCVISDWIKVEYFTILWSHCFIQFVLCCCLLLACFPHFLVLL